LQLNKITNCAKNSIFSHQSRSGSYTHTEVEIVKNELQEIKGI